MGYACPVCKTPQADARHLANHLAFTALLGDNGHETWLAVHAPEWAQAGEAKLADSVVEHADEVEFPQVFEDTTDHDHHGHDDPRPGDLFEEDSRQQSRGPERGRSGLDPETAEAIEKAREMTRETRNEGESEDESEEHTTDENE